MENDGAAAIIVVAADRARDFGRSRPSCWAWLGRGHRSSAPVHNSPNYGSADFATWRADLWRMARPRPSDVDMVQR